MRGRKDLVWIDHRGVAHGLRFYEKWRDGQKRGVTWCGWGLNLNYHGLRRLPATCMTCVVNAARQ